MIKERDDETHQWLREIWFEVVEEASHLTIPLDLDSIFCSICLHLPAGGDRVVNGVSVRDHNYYIMNPYRKVFRKLYGIDICVFIVQLTDIEKNSGRS